MSLQIGGRSWAQWNWMDRLGSGPVPTIVLALQSFFDAVNPNHPGHHLSLPNLPNQGNAATNIGFRIRFEHPIAAWSVLMRTISADPPFQHTSRDKLSLEWNTGFDSAYRPSGSGLVYGDFHPDSSGRWIFQQGMPYINHPDVGGTVLMVRDTTPGQEQILFWLANHGAPVASNPWYAPQWFSLAWQDSINSWLFVARSYRNQRPAGTDQSGPVSLTASLWPSGVIWSGLGIGMQNTANTLWSEPYLIYPSLTTLRDLGALTAGGDGARFHYPPGMVAGSIALATVSGRPFDGNRLNVPGFPTLYQLGTFSTINTSLASDDFLFLFLPQAHTVPDGWLPAAEAFPWRELVEFGCRLHALPRASRIGQASFNTPDGQTIFWPQLVGLSQAPGHPFYERFAADLIGGGSGGSGGGTGGSSRPGAGVLWPRRG
jgi:hypothetical protein